MSEILWDPEKAKAATNTIEASVSEIVATTKQLNSVVTAAIEQSSGKWDVIESTAKITAQLTAVSEEIKNTTEIIKAALRAYDDQVAEANDDSGIRAITD